MVSNIERGHYDEDRAMDDRLSPVERAKIYEQRCECIMGDIEEMAAVTADDAGEQDEYQEICKRYDAIEHQLKQIRKLAEKLRRRAIVEAEAELAFEKAQVW